MSELEDIRQLLVEIRDNQLRSTVKQDEHIALAQQHLERAKTQVEESIGLQRRGNRQTAKHHPGCGTRDTGLYSRNCVSRGAVILSIPARTLHDRSAASCVCSSSIDGILREPHSEGC